MPPSKVEGFSLELILAETIDPAMVGLIDSDGYILTDSDGALLIDGSA